MTLWVKKKIRGSSPMILFWNTPRGCLLCTVHINSHWKWAGWNVANSRQHTTALVTILPELLMYCHISHKWMNLRGMFAVTWIFLRGLPAAKANSVGLESFQNVIYACQVIVTHSVPSRWEIYTRHCEEPKEGALSAVASVQPWSGQPGWAMQKSSAA